VSDAPENPSVVPTSTAGPDLGSPFLQTSVTNGVLHLRIDRPERRNAFAQDMYRGIKRAATWADRQIHIDAVCLTGTDRWFGSGGDLSRREDVPDLAVEWDGTDHFPFRHIERCRKIWVAKINGVCHAGGLGIALHCDVTIASDRATFQQQAPHRRPDAVQRRAQHRVCRGHGVVPRTTSARLAPLTVAPLTLTRRC
jgi:hypothetical protein